MRMFVALLIGVVGLCSSNLFAMKQGSVTKSRAELVPQNMLSLLHAPEVHQELKLTNEQVADLESFFEVHDGTWFRARALPAEKQREIISQIESEAHAWLEKNVSAKQRERMEQLEYQSQSARMMIRDDLAKKLGLDHKQQQRFVELAKNTNEQTMKLQKAVSRGEASDALTSSVTLATKAELEAVKDILKPEQQKKLWQLLGTPFETSKLKRVYPKAPELVAVRDWINSSPLTLHELKGKVVLVHFYAFQCSNCHANFPIYRRWHEQLSDKGVVVIGIQTPELAAERNANAVRSAASENNLTFPIMVDLASENWNAWANTMWPTVYVIDKNGYIRHWWQGELKWKGASGDRTIEELVDTLLAE